MATRKRKSTKKHRKARRRTPARKANGQFKKR